jgi:hypothetical protein
VSAQFKAGDLGIRQADVRAVAGDSPPITRSDALWAIEKARDGLSGVKALLAASSSLERFLVRRQG